MAQLDTIKSYIGKNCIGKSYIGKSCIGKNCTGKNCTCKNYVGKGRAFSTQCRSSQCCSRVGIVILLWVAVFSLASCVNLEPYDVQRLQAEGYLQHSIELTEAPFFAQEANQCGPSALATVINDLHSGESGNVVTPESLSASVYLPEREGSLQPLLVAKARDYGLPYVREGEGLAALLAEVNIGKPVLILQNLGLAFAPNWHYAVVVGWDAEAQEAILRSGQHKRQRHSLKFLEYTWRASNYWSLSLYHPSDTPSQPREATWLKAASGLESIGKLAWASQAYRAIAHYYPTSFLAYMGKGNTAYQLERYAQAAAAYQKALSLSDSPAAAHHNLAWALIRQNALQQAKVHASKAAMLDARYSSALDFLQEN